MQGGEYGTGLQGVIRVGQGQGTMVYLYQYPQYPLYQYPGILRYYPGMEGYSIIGTIPCTVTTGYPMDPYTMEYQGYGYR